MTRELDDVDFEKLFSGKRIKGLRYGDEDPYEIERRAAEEIWRKRKMERERADFNYRAFMDYLEDRGINYSNVSSDYVAPADLIKALQAGGMTHIRGGKAIEVAKPSQIRKIAERKLSEAIQKKS